MGIGGYVAASVFSVVIVRAAEGREYRVAPMALLAVAGGLGAVVAGFAFLVTKHDGSLPCPHCAQPFYRSVAEEIGSPRPCAHCGIRIGTLKRDARPVQG